MGINAGTAARFGQAPVTPAQAAQTAQISQTLQFAGAGVQAIGAISNVMSQRLALEGAAEIAQINARMAEHAAQQEMANGQEMIARTTERAGQVKGAQRAAMAANGIDLGVGSAAEVLTSTDLVKTHDMQVIESNAVRAAWGHRINATSLTNQADMSRAGANSLSPLVAGTSSLLSSGGQIAGSWYSMNKNGVAPKGT